MIEIRNTLIPFKGFKAINICGLLFIRKEAKMTEADLNHERIHTAQMKELLFLPFYLIYLIEWLWHMANGKSSLKAYRAISFEREAYANERNPYYLLFRQRYAQWRS